MLPCQAAGCAKIGVAMAKAKQGGGWSWALSRPLRAGGKQGSPSFQGYCWFQLQNGGQLCRPFCGMLGRQRP